MTQHMIEQDCGLLENRKHKATAVLTEIAPGGHRASPGMIHGFSGRGVAIYYLLNVNIPLTHWNFEFTLPTLLIFKTSTAFEK